MDTAESREGAEGAKPGPDARQGPGVAGVWRIAWTMTDLKDDGRTLRALLGATLSIALAFLIALMVIHPLDAPLTVASRAVGFAVPILGSGLLFSLVRPGPGVRPFLVNLFHATAAFVLEPLGGVATLIAFVGLLWHIDPGSVLAAVVGEGVTFLAGIPVLLAFVLALYLVDRAAKRRGETLTPEELISRSRFASLFVKDPDASGDSADGPAKQN